MTQESPGGIRRYGPDDDPHVLALGFAASRQTVEGALALVMEWAERLNAAQDDIATLRLVLEELLINILFHALGEPPSPSSPSAAAQLPSSREYIYLLLEFHASALPGGQDPASPPPPALAGSVRIEIKDKGEPFNPFSPAEAPAARQPGTPGGRGLTLVRLFSTRHAYARKDGRNEISLRIPLGGAPQPLHGPASPAPGEPEASGKAPFPRRLRRAWRQKMLFRLTAVFTISIFLICCFGTGVYQAAIIHSQADNAEARALQSMITQEEVSRAFLKRVEAGLLSLSSRLSSLPRADAFMSDSEAVLRLVRERNLLGPFRAAVPVAGFVLGQNGGQGVWFFQKDGTGVSKEWVPSAFDAFAPVPGKSPEWQGPLRHIPARGMDRHAAMIFSLPAGKNHWMGMVLTMPWIENTLRAISGFELAAPIFLNTRGEYVIYPPGRSRLDGPQSLGQDAALPEGKALRSVLHAVLGGEAGLEGVGFFLRSLWSLPWDGPSSLFMYPMKLPGWRMAMLVPDRELGAAPSWFPLVPLLAALASALLVGLVTALTAKRVLTPLRQLADSLERLGQGDMGTPFPVPRSPDETGLMLQDFERTRVILKASLQSLVQGAAGQERLRHQLALARSIQENMIPTEFPALPEIDIAAGIDMAFEVCGDLYDCFILDAGPEAPPRAACIIGDVCGKGIPAALMMSSTLSLARAFLLQGFSPARTLERLNDAILRRDLSSMFVTLLIGIYDSKDATFTWSSAGHPAPVLSPGPGTHGPASAVALPWPNELVLGVRPEVRYSSRRLRLRPGQAMLLRTDGADEAMGLAPPGAPSGGPLYGEERLVRSFGLACQAVRDLADSSGRIPALQKNNAPITPSAGILERLRRDLVRHTGARPPHDDITLMVIRREARD